tara:strand:+ start:20306 stop:20605 length:300 start_codon:yes stop_codon:yes gene_type:complete
MSRRRDFDDDFILKVIAEITPKILKMEVGEEAIAEEMFEEDDWHSYSPYKRRTDVGDLISDFSSKDLFPLKFNEIRVSGRCNEYIRTEIKDHHLIQPDS